MKKTIKFEIEIEIDDTDATVKFETDDSFNAIRKTVTDDDSIRNFILDEIDCYIAEQFAND